MIRLPDEDDRAIVDDVLPAEIVDLAVPVALDRLLPWHRPRKQLVRENQWINLSRRLIEKERNKPGLRAPGTSLREVRYLTLPGIDYLDVRQLADVCRELDCSLTSTGFQSGGERNPYVARAQLRETSLMDAGHITNRSHTFPRRFEDIVRRDSLAYLDLKSRAPFHIVNVDACGSIAEPEGDDANRLIDALYRIVELQLQLMTSRWLLFVTTYVHPESIAQPTLEKLCSAIYANADENGDFRDGVGDLLNAGGNSIRDAAHVVSLQAGISFLQLFSLGLAKWFLHLGRTKTWEMRTHFPYCYAQTPERDRTPSMVCLAFEFRPPPERLEDRFGVVYTEPAESTQQEDMSVRAIEKIREMADADVRIGSDAPLRARMTQELRKWLQEAGYEAPVLAGLGG